MVFTITKKDKVNSEVLYNSPEHQSILGKIDVEPSNILKDYKRENNDFAYILKPVMDTLCLTMPLNDRQRQLKLIKRLRNWDSNVQDVDINKFNKWTKEPIEHTSKHAGYNKKYKISIEGINILLQLEPTVKKQNFIRLTMQPSLFNASGIQKFWSTLSHLSDEYIDESYISEQGSPTQIDWAIDFINVPMDDLIILKPGSFRKKRLFISGSGEIETDYIQHGEDAEEHKHSKAYVYDKAKHPSKDKKYTNTDIPVSRVEFRTYPEHSKLSQFMNKKFGLKNRFDKHEVIDLMAKKTTNPFDTGSDMKNGYLWKLFSDHMRIRGREVALQTLPSDIASEYKKVLSRQLKLTWHPSELWQNTPLAVKKFLSKVG